MQFLIDFFSDRYGEDASVLTENAAYAIGNSALTAYYVGGLRAKKIKFSMIGGGCPRPPASLATPLTVLAFLLLCIFIR